MNTSRFIQNTILSSLLGLGVAITTQADELFDSSNLLELGTHLIGHGHGPFNNSDLIGTYGYSLAGNYGPGLVNFINEVGAFKANGHGHIKGEGRTVDNGSTELSPVYDCSYTVHPIGTVDIACDRTDENGTIEAKFFAVIDDHNKEVRFEASPFPPFDIIAVTGAARKQ